MKLYAFLMWLATTMVGAVLVASAWSSDVCAPVTLTTQAMAYVGGAMLCCSMLMVLPVVFRQLFHAREPN